MEIEVSKFIEIRGRSVGMIKLAFGNELPNVPDYCFTKRLLYEKLS